MQAHTEAGIKPAFEQSAVVLCHIGPEVHSQRYALVQVLRNQTQETGLRHRKNGLGKWAVVNVVKCNKQMVTTLRVALKKGPNACPLCRCPANDLENIVLEHVRSFLSQPSEYMAGLKGPSSANARSSLKGLALLWEELFPKEKERLISILIERIVVFVDGAEITLSETGVNELLNELHGKRKGA